VRSALFALFALFAFVRTDLIPLFRTELDASGAKLYGPGGVNTNGARNEVSPSSIGGNTHSRICDSAQLTTSRDLSESSATRTSVTAPPADTVMLNVSFPSSGGERVRSFSYQKRMPGA
jgi:hypothetical protein